jgi:hypothetical protein
LSERFSFNDLLGFFEFCFFGDLSPMASSPPSIGRGVRTVFARCGAQRSNHPLVTRDAERCSVATGSVGWHMPPTETRTQRSTVREIVKDHAATLSATTADRVMA